MKPLSMRHFILIKSRCRLNGQPAVPFLKEILNGNSGRPSGLQSRLPKQENMLRQTSKHFYFQHHKQEPYPFHPSGPAMEGENGLPPFPSAPRTPEQPRRFRASPNDTQSSFTEPGPCTCSAPPRQPPAGKSRFRLPSFHQKRRLSAEPGKTACPLLKRRIKAGKRRPCPEGTWRSGASAGKRRPHPPSQDPERLSSRWKPSFPPRPSGPLHGRP